MSYHDCDYGGQYGGSIPPYRSHDQQQQQPRQYQGRQMLPSQGRRGPPPQGGGYGSNASRGPPPVRPARPQPPPPPAHTQQYNDSTENLYDGSAYGEPDYSYAEEQHDSWPLPAAPSRPYPQQPERSGSPSNSSPRRPPQRPQRPDYQEPSRDPPRQQPQHPAAARVAPANQQYRQAPPQQPQALPTHHGSGQWTGEGYSSPSAYAQPSMLQPQYQQGAYGQANKRPPLGPPPSARRGPASYYPQVAPVHPIAEETDSMRGSVRNGGGSSIGGLTGHDSMKSYASSNAIPIGIPDYYLQARDSHVPSLQGREDHYSRSVYAEDERPVSAGAEDESPIDPSGASVGDGRVSRLDERNESPVSYSREEPSPEPAALVRQASLGRKSKPTLTTVKSGDRLRKDSVGTDGRSSLPSQQKGADMPMSPPVPQSALAKEAALDKELGGRPSADTDESRSFEDSKRGFGNGDKALEAGGAAAVAAAAVGAPVYAASKLSNKSKDNVSRRTDSSEIFGLGSALEPSSSDSDSRSMKKKGSKELLGVKGSRPGLQKQLSRERSPLAKEVDPRMSEILTGLEKGGALTPGSSQTAAGGDRLKTPMAGLSERAGKRRPPRLNVDAVRDAEARGSLTSLPDLIKRATRLASNLDRGKTASRLGMTWMADADGSSGEKDVNRRSGSISDILNSFPPPGLATPPASRHGERGERMTNWPSNLRHSQLPSNSDADGALPDARRKRRCCGMPLWLFLLVLILLICLIAAAIIMPVVLIVVPKQNSNASSSTGTTSEALTKCQSSLTCQNGGANIISSSGTCQCLCVNGYTGSTCSTPSGAGCTTTSVGSTNDATVGDAIPRLLTRASNFSVPLDGQTLLGLFSGADMSCQSENALVTFDNDAGAKKGRREAKNFLPPVQPVQPTATVLKRQTATSGSSDNAATSNGIIYETGSPSMSSSAPSATSSAASSSSSASGSATSMSGQQEDFARVAVLYVFQASGQFNDAATAQENIQRYFSYGTTTTGQAINARNVSLGNSYSCDLVGYGITAPNGTAVGQT